MTPSPKDAATGFGANEWLVDELYQAYLTDKSSVDEAWWDFFADYKPSDGSAVRTHSVVPAVEAAPQAAAVPTPAPTPAPPAVSPTPPAVSPPVPAPAAVATPPAPESTHVERLRGPAARVVANMEASLTVPTATSVRDVPAKLLIDNRTVINNHLARGRGGKVSFTHLIGYAIVLAAKQVPAMNFSFTELDGKPAIALHEQINLGLAIDVAKADGSRTLLVPSIKDAQSMDFAAFWGSYEDVVRRARQGSLEVSDFQGTSISLTNPGTIGTSHSVPRLMPEQGTIVGVGAMEYPAEWQGASEEARVRNAVSKIMTLTSTYDHRIIQGAQSGEFLKRIHELLLGGDNFYEKVFRSLRIPYEPIQWAADISASHETDLDKTVRVQEVIHAYRVRGHLMADINPLEYEQRAHPDLDVLTHGLTLWDLDREFATGGFAGRPLMKLREILGVLRDSYTRTIGIEYMHIQDPEQRAWIQERVEVPHVKPTHDEQLTILRKLNEGEAFETFLQTKYVGQKRFSLEGSEALIPLIDTILSDAADENIIEVAIGMPHRGRLNVLANIAGKSYGQIFAEFEGNYGEESVQGSGDVKYHLGTSGTYTNPQGLQTNVYLAANPSHLEAVNPVLEGVVRAKQDQLPRDRSFDILPMLLHGDAAFAGQGVVVETLHLSQLQGYRTGGTVHIVVNNQVGFTTSPKYSRSSVYATDAARMIQSPVFHVNGDDPEAVTRVAQLAFAFRQAFHKDVVIDMVCYRRRGHNEADDPSLTQPMMYNLIDAKRSVRKNYTEALIGRGDITVEEAEEALRHFQEQLEGVFQQTRAAAAGTEEEFSESATTVVREGQKNLVPQGPAAVVDTSISQEQVDEVVKSQLEMPAGFTLHPRLAPQLQRRGQMVADGTIDWGMAEALAVGSLLSEGRSVRLVGQDSRRGTFGHRHMVIVDRENGWQYKPLKRMYRDGAKLWVYDSLLSEFAAVGFEYGYSVARPDALVIWEAQFGDFVNGAQTIIDEFISAGEQKWNQRSSLTMLLPHGYEGQGPDHSSARVERFLQLCAQDNMTVSMPSTPASYFHLLRWQMHSRLTRPLVIFTPKSLLRAKFASSKLEDFTTGSFRAILRDNTVAPEGVKKVLLCSGKVYYDLVAEREKTGATDTAIVRLERFYPLPFRSLPGVIDAYPNDVDVRWVQEEPANQGAWSFMALSLPSIMGRPISVVCRPASSSPAVGSHHRHEEEQRAVVAAAFAD
ncbi:MAG: multifunctional oxoglutarate decarboxylase/oxoglutarate dehydrogenase thiamine pyrophosphate-binding subunit/dihydrolipoyllysine-residue succinyltransferase subunit [Candidatus Nanopelagicales bacterium]|nr:multifunctional oxoglutarate decarboxylase/oxoglutarate dehydrogenase thiamine pyrophosphate-binding subunit/dihydrolipoyllysine-residue succinyltransferase subunit [Candidatus Nanopelagicales bacterium]